MGKKIIITIIVLLTLILAGSIITCKYTIDKCGFTTSSIWEEEAFTNIEMSGLTLFLVIALSIAWAVIWIATIIHQAKRKRWVWMVLTIIFNITVLVYWIVWLVSKKFRRKRR